MNGEEHSTSISNVDLLEGTGVLSTDRCQALFIWLYVDDIINVYNPTASIRMILLSLLVSNFSTYTLLSTSDRTVNCHSEILSIVFAILDAKFDQFSSCTC